MPDDYAAARKARGTPKVSMSIEAERPGDPNPVDAPKPKPPAAKPGTQEFLNKPNDYDKNTYTPDMFPIKAKPTLSRT